jgi:hypothetical protein
MTPRRNKVRTRRKRQHGLQPIETGMPDVGSLEFKADAHRQSLAIAHSPYEKADQEFVDAVSEWNSN